MPMLKKRGLTLRRYISQTPRMPPVSLSKTSSNP
nr:MAG TPA: hypothetical protein [Caudoviricetes sp.]